MVFMLKGVIMAELTFVSYDGNYPNKCSGTLVLALDGVEVVFPKYSLSSAGCISFGGYRNEEVREGRWTIPEFPEGFPDNLKSQAVDLVNSYIGGDCCGGCR
jgi:hypothetical protein